MQNQYLYQTEEKQAPSDGKFEQHNPYRKLKYKAMFCLLPSLFFPFPPFFVFFVCLFLCGFGCCFFLNSSLGCLCQGFHLSTTYLLRYTQSALMLLFPGKPWNAIFVRRCSTKHSLQWTWASVLVTVLNLTPVPCLSLCSGDVGSAGQPKSLPRGIPVRLQGQMVAVSQAVWTCGGEFQGGEFSSDLPAQNQCRRSSFDVTAL